MSTLRKELVREIMADGGFTKANDIGVYLRDMFKKKKIDYPFVWAIYPPSSYILKLRYLFVVLRLNFSFLCTYSPYL
ncbi:hypothetical protein KQI18_11310 [Clostridioides mangenotii]|uniref:hypothetical protein n=1 Tax=Metaclostridioides mangenotii TaxID=1540 RepID=UPI001C119DE0|nr:hypothetical protein [Clostridioides mangenotii]MBU5308365.1 hypothetical protein [Clostridioides mangenotii]